MRSSSQLARYNHIQYPVDIHREQAMRHLNYNHLHYFWMVAREGSIARAAELLYLTPQTISGQLRLLEDTMGSKLFARSGRNLVLTELGQTVYQYADRIFALGTELVDVLKGRTPEGPLLFTVGIADVVPKLVCYRLLEPALRIAEPIRVVCREGKLGDLLGDLALHKVDMILADSPLTPTVHIRAYNHLLGDSGISFFTLADNARTLSQGFPGSLDGTPMLLPTENTMLRSALEQWFEHQGISPIIAGEFEDSALLKAFGQAGIGVFASPTVIEHEVERQYATPVIGRTEKVRERFYAISAERRIKHPAVMAISDEARQTVFKVAS
jgi:LysR family transcriptional activator of nhaA